MTHLQIGDLYKHIKSNHIHILMEISESCVHLHDLSHFLCIERTIRNDVFERMWVRVGDNA